MFFSILDGIAAAKAGMDVDTAGLKEEYIVDEDL